MKKTSFVVLSIALVLLTLLFIVACSGETQPATPKKSYIVTFESDGGTTVDPVTVEEDQKVKQPAIPKKEGYYFGGWWTKNSKGNFSSKYVFTKKVSGDLTLYARWYTTDYYMPAGWASTVTTPMWTTKDANTVTVPDAVLQGDGVSETTNVTDELKEALATALATPGYFKDVKNVIVIISDGMGITHVQASEKWSGDLIMTRLPYVGASVTSTRELDSKILIDDITDSAAGGTALSTGYKTTKLFSAMDAEGNNLKSVSELAREKGKLVGIVTNAKMADATPAVYSIHNKHRSQGWDKICQQQVVFGADLFMGNGASEYVNFFDSGNFLNKFVKSNNMAMYMTAEEMVEHFDDDIKMWALFPATSNKFARFDTTNVKYPNLQQMTAYALSWLDAHADDDKGFVVMIENTYTDHFGHGNNPDDGSDNTYGIVKEVQSTDEAVAIALKYVLEHPDTALIVTADHETGDTTLRTGWEDNFTKIKTNSTSHSTQDVPVFAIGKGTEVLDTLNRTEEERAAGQKWDQADSYENYVIGQVVGSLLGEDHFGGDVKNDTYGKTSPKFEITTNEESETLTFTLELKGVPVRINDHIQFKIKPVSSSDSIKVELAGDENALLGTTVFFKKDNGIIERDGNGNVITPLMKAYNQAFIEGSGIATGWYQLSLPASINSSKIVITLTSGSGSFPAGSKIGMDDLTIQYGSTIGELLFSSTNATATGECLVVLN